MIIKTDAFLVKRKKCPFKETYLRTWNEILCKHDEGHQEVIRVGSIACAACKYFDMDYAKAQEGRLASIKCNHG